MDQLKVDVYGAPWCPDCKRTKQFLNEQRFPYRWFDIDQDEQAREYVQQANNGRQIIPTVLLPDGSILTEPTNAELTEALGIRQAAQLSYHDLIIIGAGPAGLTSGIYSAREGLSTLIIERSGVGGQAGLTQEIENYPGFPESIAGSDLADRLRAQAERFEVEILPAQEVSNIQRDGDL
jgi:thioredoxin reductase (NADPH)